MQERQDHVFGDAKWIWLDYITPFGVSGEYKLDRFIGIKPHEKNRWGIFRKTFTLSALPLAGNPILLRISADSRYKLYINGDYIGRGIYRCNRFNWYYDEYDVSMKLRAGPNVIAIVATYYGEHMSWYEPMPNGPYPFISLGKGGVIFSLEIPLQSGVLRIKSDRTTLGKICAAWEQNVPRVNVGLPFVEIFDSHAWDDRWLSTEFTPSDLADWNHTIELKEGNHQLGLTKCDIPRLEEIPLRAENLLNAGTVDSFFDDEDLGEPESEQQDRIDFMIQMAMSPLRQITANWLQKWPDQNIEWNLGDGPLGLVFDMGKVVSGFPYFEFEADLDGVVVDVAWSEKLVKGSDPPVPDLSAWRSKFGFRYKGHAGTNRYDKFHWNGFRYLQMNISGPPDAVVKIKDVGTILYLYPAKEEGKFSCSDPDFTNLYRICGWTLRNCMHDGFEDCPSREQRQWVGDAYVEVMTAFAMYGTSAVPLVRKLLKQVAESLRGDGITEMVTPGDLMIHGVHIPDYSLYYIMTVFQTFWWTGDLDLLRTHLPIILRIMQWWTQFIDPVTGLLTDVPQWLFIDWSQNDKWGACGAVNAQFYHVIQLVLQMVEYCKWGDAAYGLDEIAQRIAQGMNKFLWIEEEHAYLDAVKVNPAGDIIQYSNKITFHTNALAIVVGITPEDWVPAILQRVFDRPYSQIYVQNRNPLWEKRCPAQFIPGEHVVMAEPFFMHHIHQMLATVNRYDLIERYLRDGWVEMVRAGASTIWETWGSGGSHCHAWSTTPAYDFATHCLGVKFLVPGGTKVKIDPHALGLSWAEGTIPTRHGTIHIRWDLTMQNGIPIYHVRCQAPDAIQIEFGTSVQKI
jgi:hypothetical protein